MTELEKQENRLDTLRAERVRLQAELGSRQAELDELVRDISFERTL